jgi:hypothetical protein
VAFGLEVFKVGKKICKNHFKLKVMKYETTKEFILEAHKSACEGWKTKIEKEFPDVFKNQYNKWYKHSYKGIFFFTDYRCGYGIDSGGGWHISPSSGIDSGQWTPATDTEVSEMLIKEAKKRGFVQGVTVESCVMSSFIRKIEKEDYKFTKYNQLTTGSITLFENGKWATIVEQPTEMTHDEIEKALGKKIKIGTK